MAWNSSKEQKVVKQNNREEYLSDAKKVADLVESSVENREFSGLDKKLEELPSAKVNKTQYVFAAPSNTLPIIGVICTLVFAAVYIYFAWVGMGVAIYSKEYAQYGLLYLASFAIVIIIAIVVIINAVKYTRFTKRYEKYCDIFKYKNIEIINDLSAFSKISESRIIADLSTAVKRKMIPEGHFGTDNIIFITSDELYNAYKEKQALYDRYYKNLLEERFRMLERPADIQQIIDTGQEYVDKIRECNDMIKEKEMSQKLDRLEKIVAMIFREVDINPDHAGKLGMFLNYYLPTTEKLLNIYVSLNSKEIQVERITSTKIDIEKSLDKINASFEGILNQFFSQQEMDIASDISTMEVMLKQDGISDD